MKNRFSRRRFLGQTAVGCAAVLYGRNVLSANEDIRVAVLGLGGKGRHHVNLLQSMAGIRLVALCDVDPRRLDEQVQKCPKVFSHTDPRAVLDRKDIDAVVIATPDHWHALLAIWACQAGMDVYVEKPVSHNIQEGRKIVEAAAKYHRIIQSGLQYRSDEGLHQAAEFIRQGQIGKPVWGHVVWYEQRGSIGKVAAYTPDWLDYDLYCGPAEVMPLRRKELHYDWHWVWSTGTGDLGNSGVHAFDVCRWFAGVSGLPRRAACLGGRFGVNDAGDTPNTQLTLLEFPEIPIIIENRNLPIRSGIKGMDNYRQVQEGVILQCEQGYFAGLRGGGWAYDLHGKKLKQFVGDGGAKHHANFFQAVRTRNAGLLNAPIAEGHISSACCHLGNLSYRLGRPSEPDDLRKVAGENREAAETIDRLIQHLRANDVDTSQFRMSAGPWLTIDSQTQEITATDGPDSSQKLEKAKRLAQGSYRAPFVIPEME